MSIHALSLPARSWILRGAPRRTVRLRLTLLYGGLFLLAGAVLLTITYVLFANSLPGGSTAFVTYKGKAEIAELGGSVHIPVPMFIASLPPGSRLQVVQRAVHTKTPGLGPGASAGAVAIGAPLGTLTAKFRGPPSGAATPRNQYFKGPSVPQARVAQEFQNTVQGAFSAERASGLHQLMLWSLIALGMMALASGALGWWVAGRVLAPLRTMTARVRRISDHNLHERLAVDGAEDELKELGDAFDAVLGRLEGAFEAQRRFVANASHELRTPLTFERAMVEVALADPDADVESLRLTCERVLEAGEQQERLIDGLLTLAQGQQGLDAETTVDLREISQHVLEAFEANRNGDGLEVESELAAAAISGDERLLERLVANLVDNAVRHNVPGGWVHIRTGLRGGRATLSVSNSGPVIAPADVDGLLEPFRRAGADRSRHRDGHGLGLSIVAAIASAHDGSLSARARAEGGLDVEVSFAP